MSQSQWSEPRNRFQHENAKRSHMNLQNAGKDDAAGSETAPSSENIHSTNVAATTPVRKKQKTQSSQTPSVVSEYVKQMGGGGMDLSDVLQANVTNSEEWDATMLFTILENAARWKTRYSPVDKSSLPARRTHGQRVVIPGYSVIDLTTDGANVPIRLMVRGIESVFPDWKTKRVEFLRRAYAELGNVKSFGTEFSMKKDGIQRGALPLRAADLHGIVPDINKVEGNMSVTIKVSLDDQIQRHILPFLLNNQNAPYCLIKASIFVDPPKSESQNEHMDLHLYDRNQLWNIFLPIQVAPGVHTAVMGRSKLLKESVPETQTNDDAIMWDGNWKHRGVGNTTSVARIMLHMVYLPVWMIESPRGQAAISKVYNNDESVNDPSTAVGYWIARYRNGPTSI